VRRAQEVVQELKRRLGIEPGDTTPDNEFTLETVACLGACALGPIVVVDGHYFSKVGPSGVDRILDKARKGLDRIEIESDEWAFPVEVSCPRCNHSLMDPDNLIDGHPSIRMMVSFGDRHDWLNLSGLYGSYEIRTMREIPPDTVVSFFCPHCHAELGGVSECNECGAAMVPLIVRNGGMIHICSRRGCKGHMLDLNGVNF
jgi:(2Fe-2S) ferredoxin